MNVEAVPVRRAQQPGGGKALIFAVPAFLAAWLLFAAAFTVDETQHALVIRLGRPVGDVISEPGLRFKVPAIDKVQYIDKRILAWDGQPNQIPTRDKKFIKVDTTARWRIVDPLKYYVSVQNERRAQGRLDGIIDSATRDVVSKHNLVEIVRDTNRIVEAAAAPSGSAEATEREERGKIERIKYGRNQLQADIVARARPKLRDEYGVEIVDLLIKRVNYEKSVQKKVFERMVSERLKIAEKIRSEGFGKKAEIEGERKKELQRIQSEAYRTAEATKGLADAEATAIYAQAYGPAQGLYKLVKSLDTYKKTLKKDAILVLSTEAEYLRHLTRSQ